MFFLFGWLLFLLPMEGLRAQPPAGYYAGADGKTGQALQQALHDLIDDHQVLTYAALWEAFKTTDTKPDSTVWDIYSDKPGETPAYVYHFSQDQCGNYAREGDCYNREHSFPKSWFGDAEPMYTDLFHIYPTDGWVNNKRGNLPFGETTAPRWSSTNGSATGPSSVEGYNGEIFEPIDAYKGDLARTYFYMATRYLGEGSSWPGSDMVTGSQLKPWALAMLLRWHREDPVSEKEIQRNNAVFALQKNRNPFIDEPRFALLIWDLPNGVPPVPAAAAGERLGLWPNPATQTVRIGLPTDFCHNPEVLLHDMTGSVVMCTGTPAGSSELGHDSPELQVDHLPPGVYLVRVICSGRQLSAPLVILPRK